MFRRCDHRIEYYRIVSHRYPRLFPLSLSLIFERGNYDTNGTLACTCPTQI